MLFSNGTYTKTKRLFLYFKIVLPVLWSLLATPLFSQTVCINEFMASNGETLCDEDGDYEDWIEVYNAGNRTVNLAGYGLTDDASAPFKWIMPERNIAPGAYLLIWASGKDRNDAAVLHTNFRLSSDGEYIGLYDPSGQPADTVSYGPQQRDRSSGRFPDGTGTCIVPMQEATPGAPNRASVHFSFPVPQGVYGAPFDLEMIRSSPIGTVHYTTDGNTPGLSAQRYEGPVAISETVVIRARVFQGEDPISEEVTALYILDETPRLPVLSLVSSWEHLWSSHAGIYVNWEQSGDDWERPATLALIEDNRTRFQHQIGIRIHGQNSRAKPKKSIRAYFRDAYGRDWLEYPLFGEDGPQKFKRLVIHSSADDASWDANFSHLRDVLTHTLWAEEGGLISLFRPVALYINGGYWGAYWLRERIDRHYIETHFDISDSDFLGHEWSYLVIKEGDPSYWEETLWFFTTHDLEDPEHYQTALEKYIDRGNFTDYHIFNIYAGNHDWPQKNSDHFRDRNGDPRWRWLMWDHDVCWKWNADKPTLEWAVRDAIRPDLRAEDTPGILWSTLLLRKLLKNQNYLNFFINRFMDLINTTLSAYNVEERTNQLAEMIRPEMHREMSRWGVSDFNVWDRNLDHIRNFVRGRETKQRDQLRDHFNLRQYATLQLQTPEGEGSVTLNSLSIDTFPWSGAYFPECTMHLKAHPAPGFRFVKWITHGNVDITEQADTDFQLMNGDAAITAVFEPCTVSASIIINEINFLSAGEQGPDDWVELFNTGSSPADLSGWTFHDSSNNDPYRIPDTTILPPEGFLVVSKDTAAFRSLHPEIPALGPLDFGLSSSGEKLVIMTPDGLIAHQVHYQNDSPWPNISGAIKGTLALISPELDNSDPANWQLSPGTGTPGAPNSFENIHPEPFAIADSVYSFDYWSSEEPDHSYPPHMMFWQSDTDDPGPAHPLAYLYTIPDYEYHDDDTLTTGYPYNNTRRTRINGLNENGISFINTGRGRDLGGAVLALDTRNAEKLYVSFSAGTVAPQARTYGLRLQYRTGRTEEFTDLEDETGNPVEYISNAHPGHVRAMGSYELPSELLNQPYVQLLWRYYHISGDSGPRAELRLDEIRAGTELPVSDANDHLAPSVPGRFTLSQNYPNPFNQATQVEYTVPVKSEVTIAVYSLLGRQMLKQSFEKMPGTHTFRWNGTDTHDRAVESGVYIITMTSKDHISRKKMVLIR